MAKEYDVIIVGSDEFMPLWYILAVDKTSKRNTVELSNIFYESGKFDFSEPDILVEYTLDCENDPLFPNQWNLKNTGQSGGISGMDIAACQAWDITKGCQNITVAVFDQGLEFNHPDFGSFSTQSFDAQTGTLGSQVRGYHGVFVAGIIAAQHNNIGISGVSPNITLMSISESFANTPGFSQRLASGINFAWNNGADIIQNSWSSNNIIQPQFVQDAINLAANSGRGGLGCIIVHATGNDQQNTINFPSNLPSVIAVGSINRNGIRANLSNYGTGIDLVAGGEDIYSTDRIGTLGINTQTSPNGDYAVASGTSFAAPQIAGTAALILSMNPSLPAIQVKNIIESTADKIPGYFYAMGAGENLSLSWNSQVGYGKANTFKALEAVFKDNIVGPNLLCSTNSFTVQNLPQGYSVASWSVSPSRLFSGSTSGTGSSAILSPFHMNSSGQATITFTVTTACGTITIPKTFWVGKPAIPGAITGNTTPGPGSYTPYYINNLPAGATSMS
jgi:hypothetical protein